MRDFLKKIKDQYPDLSWKQNIESSMYLSHSHSYSERYLVVDTCNRSVAFYYPNISLDYITIPLNEIKKYHKQEIRLRNFL